MIGKTIKKYELEDSIVKIWFTDGSFVVINAFLTKDSPYSYSAAIEILETL